MGNIGRIGSAGAAGQVGDVNSASQAGASQAASAPAGLGVGARGQQVKDLQNDLATLGYKPGAADGIFGNRTASALAQYQKATGLPPTGRADAETVAQLKDAASFVAMSKVQMKAVESAAKKLGDYFASTPKAKLPTALKNIDPKSFKLADFGDSYYLEFKTTAGKYGLEGGAASKALKAALGKDAQFKDVCVGSFDQ